MQERLAARDAMVKEAQDNYRRELQLHAKTDEVRAQIQVKLTDLTRQLQQTLAEVI